MRTPRQADYPPIVTLERSVMHGPYGHSAVWQLDNTVTLLCITSRSTGYGVYKHKRRFKLLRTN